VNREVSKVCFAPINALVNSSTVEPNREIWTTLVRCEATGQILVVVGGANVVHRRRGQPTRYLLRVSGWLEPAYFLTDDARDERISVRSE